MQQNHGNQVRGLCYGGQAHRSNLLRPQPSYRLIDGTVAVSGREITSRCELEGRTSRGRRSQSSSHDDETVISGVRACQPLACACIRRSVAGLHEGILQNIRFAKYMIPHRMAPTTPRKAVTPKQVSTSCLLPERSQPEHLPSWGGMVAHAAPYHLAYLSPQH